MHSVDAHRLDLAAEYKGDPFGPYSEELQKILKILHWSDVTDRYLAVQPFRDGPWVLGRTRGGRGESLDLYMEQSYATVAEVRWAVFQKRWQLATGVLPLVDGEDGEDPARGAITKSANIVRGLLTGYTDVFTARAGSAVAFKVSAETAEPYSAQLVRIRCGDQANGAFSQAPVDAVVNGTYVPQQQPIYPGSYVEAGLAPQHSCTLHATIWPTLLGHGEQSLVSCWDRHRQCGYVLGINTDGALTLTLGDGSHRQQLSLPSRLLERRWFRVAASIDLETQQVWLGFEHVSPLPLIVNRVELSAPLECTPRITAALRFAADSDSCELNLLGTARARAHFNGKLEAPTIYQCAVPDSARHLLLTGASWPDARDSLFACWDFSREQSGTQVVDISEHARHGTTVNMPTRAMKGVQWDGTQYDWQQRPEHYAAIHFHDDDLHDCAWKTDFSYHVPDDLPSGLYAMHLRQAELEDWIPFVVSPPVGQARNDLALLLPSASYWAYANRGSIIDFEGREHVRNTFCTADSTALMLHHHPELGLSTYDTHNDGSGVCISSRLRPVLSLRPQEILWQLSADTHLIDWLEALEFGYDVLTEDDLDQHGVDLLRPYRCVMTGTHPEYPSLAMLDAYAEYQSSGGRFMYMGGNGFYWRVSYHSDISGVMEMRRGEDGIRAWLAEGGEYYHAFTGELGGMWRRMGRAPQSVAGAGMTAQGFDRSTYYERTRASFDERVAFMFDGIGEDERIGDFGSIGGGAAGWEIDRADLKLGTPPHALIVAQATNFTSAYHWMKEELNHTHAAITGDTCPLVRCDMVFYETLGGGAVFSASSIAYAGALAHNRYQNNVSKLTANVLRRFLDPTLFCA